MIDNFGLVAERQVAGKNSSFTVLLVDDVRENLLLLEDMLEGKNRTFLKAKNGLEALELAIKYADIGLILLDVQMPEMDGYETARFLSSNPKTRNIPILFVTANMVASKDIVEGFRSGAFDYLIKPLNTTITRSKVAVFEKLYFYQEELKKTIHEREKVNEQLEKYTRVMAHDLKTPLAGIVSLVSLMKMNPKVHDIDDLIEELALLETLSTNLSDLITSVLEDSRKSHNGQDGHEMVSVEHLVRNCISILQAPLHIRFKIAGDLPIFMTRKITLQQVFQNLIGNAIKYNDKKEGLISIGFSENHTHYTFFVKDNGPGIDPKYQQLIFEEFGKGIAKSQVDNSTGLGLHFLKNSVEEAGGQIWVESHNDQGSIFYFTWKKSA